MAWPLRSRIWPATSAMASSGTATMIRSAASGMAAGSMKARAPGTRTQKRWRRVASRLATATTGQPVRLMATPRAVPTAPAPTIPTPGHAIARGARRAASALSEARLVPRSASSRSVFTRLTSLPANGAILRAETPWGGTRRPESSVPWRQRRTPAGVWQSRSVRRPMPWASVSWHVAAKARLAWLAVGPTRKYEGAVVPTSDPFGARAPLGPGLPAFYRLSILEAGAGAPGLDLGRLPVTIKILLENVLRHAGGGIVRGADVVALAAWKPGIAATTEAEIPFLPARVIMQDFTGVPAVVDLAAMRDAMAELGGAPPRVTPLVPADLVIDHSVQIDRYGTPDSLAFNVTREFERNGERYRLLRWAQTAFNDLRVVPPGTGIVHQVNLEYLASVIAHGTDTDGAALVFPDTLVGTDSHTTMINGLGVLGYGVGGIEAEAVLLGQPLYQPMPKVIGVRISGGLPEGATATDLVLVVP